MLILKMPIDKFGRSIIINSKDVSPPAGPRGVGFDLTSDGNFDIKQKQLTNINTPIQDSDCVTLGYLKKNLVPIETLKKQINDLLPFEALPVEDLKLKSRQDTVNGKVVLISRKIKNIAAPTDNEDSTNRKFVVDTIHQQMETLPFRVIENGNLEFTYVQKNGINLKRKLLNIDI